MILQGFLFGLLFITFVIGISYIISEYIDGKEGKH